MKIMDILVVIYLLCLAGMAIGIAAANISVIILCGCIFLFNAILMLRSKAHIDKEENDPERKRAKELLELKKEIKKKRSKDAD